ncbi:MAG: VWA domain-containing protein [Acidobacteriota bacterium]
MTHARSAPVLLGVCVLAVVLPWTLLGARQAQSPVFKTGVDVIVIDAAVVDRSGGPVADLTPEDFEVQIDGRVRRVSSAQFLSYTSRSAAPEPTGGADPDLPAEAGYASNESPANAGTGRRFVVLAVDQGSFPATGARAAMMAASRFVDGLLSTDRVALTTFPQPGPAVAFTGDHDAIKRGLAQVAGWAEPLPRTDPLMSLAEGLGIAQNDQRMLDQVSDRECSALTSLGGRVTAEMIAACRERLRLSVSAVVQYATRQALVSLRGLQRAIAPLGAISAPKTLVLVSASLVGGRYEPLLGTEEEIRMVERLAAATQTRLFVLHVETGFFDALGVERQRVAGIGQPDVDAMASGLIQLADATAGSVQRLVGSSDVPFERVAREMSGQYLLGVEPSEAERDGLPHKIRVRVRRPDVTVRSRAEFVIPAAASPALSAEDIVRGALRYPSVRKDLAIRLSTQTLREPDGGSLRVILSASLDRGVVAPAEVRLGYLMTNREGKSAASSIDTVRLLPAGSGPDAGLAYLGVINVPPGTYLLRFAALASDGRLGSVDHVVNAQLAAGDGLAVSDLLLVDPSRNPAKGFAPLVDGRVLGDELETYLELYPAARASDLTVEFQIGGTGPDEVLVRAAAKMTGHESARLSAETVIDLRALPPGTYRVVARIGRGATAIGEVSRPFRRERSTAPVGGEAGELAPRTAFAVGAGGSLVRPFQRTDVLGSGALAFFLKRMQQADAAGGTRAAVPAAEGLLEAGRLDEALAALGEAGSDELSVTFLRGLVLFAKGDLEAAATQFRASLRLSSDFLPAAFYLGACYAAGGHDREAAGAWLTSLVTESEARIVFDVLADALLRLRDAEQAVMILTEARERWPDDRSFVPRLAAAELLRRHEDEALALLRPYIDGRPDDVAALMLALRALYDAHAAGRRAASAAEDAATAARYADRYRAAGGPDAALVDRWVAFIRSKVR